MKISILGCGWLGLPLATFLVTRGYTVKGSTTSESKLKIIADKGVQPFLIDLKWIIHQEKSIETIQDFFDTDLLYINIPPSQNLEDYTKGIDFLAKQCERYGIQQVIFVSSTSVYPNTEGIVTEATPTEIQTISQQALIKSENLLLNNRNFVTTILRPAGLVGGSRNAGRWFAGKQQVPSGNIPVNLVHLEDCIGISHAVIEQRQFGQVFNLCADEHPTKAAFYTAQALKYDFQKPSFLMETPHDFKIISNKKSKMVLNYEYQQPNPMDF